MIDGWGKNARKTNTKNNIEKVRIEGRKRKGRPKKRWKTEVEKDLRVVGIDKWI